MTTIVRSSTSANLANCSSEFKLQGSCLLSRWRQGSFPSCEPCELLEWFQIARRWRQGSFALALLRTLRVARTNSNCKDQPSQQMTTRIVRWSSIPANLANCSNDCKDRAFSAVDDKDRLLYTIYYPNLANRLLSWWSAVHDRMSRPHNPPAPYILRHWENFINFIATV